MLAAMSDFGASILPSGQSPAVLPNPTCYKWQHGSGYHGVKYSSRVAGCQCRIPIHAATRLAGNVNVTKLQSSIEG